MVFMSVVTDALNVAAELSAHDQGRHNPRLGWFEGADEGPSQHAIEGVQKP